MVNYKQHFLGYILGIFILVFAPTSYGVQQIYLLNHDGFKLMQALKQECVAPKNIIQELNRNHYMRLMDNHDARDTFHITWIEGHEASFFKDYLNSPNVPVKIDQSLPLPFLLVADMGPELGFGLFSLTPIKQWQYVSEYTGKVILNPRSTQINFHSIDISFPHEPTNSRIIDASAAGNATRFALNLPKEDTLQKEYTLINNLPNEQVATANLAVFVLYSDALILLIAKKNIGPLELLGYYYGPNYSCRLLSPGGDIIPIENYSLVKRELIIMENTDDAAYIGSSSLNLTTAIDLDQEIVSNTINNRTFFQDTDNCVFEVNHDELVSLISDKTIQKPRIFGAHLNITLQEVPYYIQIENVISETFRNHHIRLETIRGYREFVTDIQKYLKSYNWTDEYALVGFIFERLSQMGVPPQLASDISSDLSKMAKGA